MAPRSSFDLEKLAAEVATIFDQVQSSAATHRKNAVNLHKLHNGATAAIERPEKDGQTGAVRLAGEKEFTQAFLHMLNRVLVVKKGVPAAERTVKFIATYIKFTMEKNGETENDDDDTSASRFTALLLKHLLKGFQARNKDVRFRCVNLVSEVILYLGEMDQDLYETLRSGLIERLSDKEPLIRLHSAVALSRLAISENPEDLDDDEQPIIALLLNSLLYDPAAEVRRATLIHIPFIPQTLSACLSRTRDIDILTRKLVYSTVLTRLAHPKQLTISQREQIVVQGLGDREGAVRISAANLLASWVDLCEGDLVSFLQLFDVRTSTEIALDALKSVFITRSEVVESIELDDSLWLKLRPESALLMRALVEYCVDKDSQALLEKTVPVVTALAFHLLSHYNAFLNACQGLEQAQADTGDSNASNEIQEEKIADEEFIMSEILCLAVHLDYTDEIGRRKMFSVVRSMLAHSGLPEPLIKPCISLLSVMSPNERDLIRVIVEVINELRDSDAQLVADEDKDKDDVTTNDDSTITIARPTGLKSRDGCARRLAASRLAEADETDLRCLCLCAAVLENVHGSFEENSTLEGILTDLIVPSVKRRELILREKGLVCLGLCCLIAKNMALSSFQLFLSQVKGSPESMRLKVLQVLFDIMMTYEKDIMRAGENFGDRVVAFIMQVLEEEESKRVQALICLGLSKLMLFGLVTDERVLTSLILAYVSPVSADNHELRQCLAYFLPVYCYSSPKNQYKMQSVLIAAFDLVTKVYDDLDEDQDMITPLQFGQLLIDWTDSSKAVTLPGEANEHHPAHVHLSIDILKALYDNERSVNERKTLCQLLSKLVFSNDVSQRLLFTAYILITYLQELVPFEDYATDRLFLRFQARFEKYYFSALATYNEQACFQDQLYEEAFGFIGVSKPRQRGFEGHTATSAAPQSESEAEDTRKSSKSTRNRSQTPTAKASDRSDGSDSGGSTSNENPKVNDKYIPSQKKNKGKYVIARSSTDSSQSEEKSMRSLSRSRRTHANAKVPMNEDDTSDDDSDSQEEGLTAHNKSRLPSTPPRKEKIKRPRTPAKTPSMASPAPKRQNRGATILHKPPLPKTKTSSTRKKQRG